MIIISGLSGAGKTVALHTLEDSGYYCIDNLPINLLPALYEEQQSIKLPVAVGIDIRSKTSEIKQIPTIIDDFRQNDKKTKLLFLNASNDILIKRFSESRRKHPLTDSNRPLIDAIELEKRILSPLLLTSNHVIDTSKINIYNLKDRVNNWLDVTDNNKPTVTIESFGFKNGVPIDADLMFDVRFLPNPYWQEDIRHLNGTDKAIQNYLLEHKITNEFVNNTASYLEKWLPTYLGSNRSYLTIAIGCTGGKHRSVFTAEKIAEILNKKVSNINIRHRDLQKK